MLNLEKLKIDLQKLMEECSNCCEDAAYKWAKAIKIYATDIVPTSSVTIQASEILESELTDAFDICKPTVTMKGLLSSQDRSVEIEEAFSNFVNLVSSGIDKAYISNPPAIPVGFANLFTLPHPKTHKEAADRFATAIDNWIKTGTVTVVSTSATVNWS